MLEGKIPLLDRVWSLFRDIRIEDSHLSHEASLAVGHQFELFVQAFDGGAAQVNCGADKYLLGLPVDLLIDVEQN